MAPMVLFTEDARHFRHESSGPCRQPPLPGRIRSHSKSCYWVSGRLGCAYRVPVAPGGMIVWIVAGSLIFSGCIPNRGYHADPVPSVTIRLALYPDPKLIHGNGCCRIFASNPTSRLLYGFFVASSGQAQRVSWS